MKNAVTKSLNDPALEAVNVVPTDRLQTEPPVVSSKPVQQLIDEALKDRPELLETDVDLKAVARALVSAPEAWAPEQVKIKHPAEWIVAALRATGQNGVVQRIVGALNLLGEPLWRPPAPKGFSDDSAAWLSGVPQRLDIANTFAQRVADRLDPDAIAEATIGPLASAETRSAIRRAESKPQALTM